MSIRGECCRVQHVPSSPAPPNPNTNTNTKPNPKTLTRTSSSQVFGFNKASCRVPQEDRLPTLPFDAVVHDLARLLVNRKDSSVACLSPRARLSEDEVRVRVSVRVRVKLGLYLYVHIVWYAFYK